jgi:hypothetical protein
MPNSVVHYTFEQKCQNSPYAGIVAYAESSEKSWHGSLKNKFLKNGQKSDFWDILTLFGSRMQFGVPLAHEFHLMAQN